MRLLWYSLPILSGWWLSLSCPPHRVPETVWVALVPLLIFIRHAKTPWRALCGGWVAGVVYFLMIVHPFLSLIWWGWAQTPEEYAASLRQQRLFLMIWYPLTALWCGAWWGLWGASLVGLSRSPHARVWLAAGLWIVLCEFLRSATFFDFTWGFLGYALHPYETLRQAASVAGLMGLSALIVLANAWGAHLLWTLGALQRATRTATPFTGMVEPRRDVRLTVGVLAVWLAAVGAGALSGTEGHEDAQGISVRVAVPQVDRRPYTREELTSGELDRAYTPLVEEARQDGAELIVLPESVWLGELALDDVPVPQTLSPQVSADDVKTTIASWLGASGAVVLVGFDVAEHGKMHNAIVAADATGLLARYDKRRLTPFAEYPPGVFQRLAPRGRITFTPGKGSQPFAVHGIQVGGFICQEAQFPSLIRQSVRDGAQLLVTTGNDRIFANPAVAAGHHVMAQFRAIETHRPLARAMKGGISSILDARGRPLAIAGIDSPALLLGEVAASNDLTPYVRWGEWPVALASLLIAFAAWRRFRAAGSHRFVDGSFPAVLQYPPPSR